MSPTFIGLNVLFRRAVFCIVTEARGVSNWIVRLIKAAGASHLSGVTKLTAFSSPMKESQRGLQDTFTTPSHDKCSQFQEPLPSVIKVLEQA